MPYLNKLKDLTKGSQFVKPTSIFDHIPFKKLIGALILTYSIKMASVAFSCTSNNCMCHIVSRQVTLFEKLREHIF